MGPHPTGNFQVVVPVAELALFSRWLSFNRHGLSVLLHPITTDQVADHTTYGLWVGPSIPHLDLDFLAILARALAKMGLPDQDILDNIAHLRPDLLVKVKEHF
ncbi:Aste57867_19996 [Aphanomyces stellatus]|uniref:Aste57867_19996 protein n=1 Tax=Aphanomyces stellatus TaxID=120398 RepID=A0A485LDZ3_9STRA|nr:hypothetical protein As57867_019930 [Aphanomyces stellatus]VFT96693.1 Aste57867_19996 [Aphanomyces stellatus]